MTQNRCFISGRLLGRCGLLIAALGGAVLQARELSLTDFAREPSGALDATAAIRRAIAELGSAGGEVHLPPGRYEISDPLVIEHAPVTLRGDGRGSIVVLKTHGRPGIVIRDCNYSGLCDLTVEGDASADAEATSVRLESTYHCFLKQVLVRSGGSGIEIVNGISPILEDVDLKDLSGKRGIWLHGTGGLGSAHRKVDAACFSRLAGGALGNTRIEWLVVGPNVDGLGLLYARFVGGSRALVLRGGKSQDGDTRPKYIHTYDLGSDHASDEAVLVEAGNDLFMADTWIGQNRHADGVVIGPGFTGGAELTNLRIRGSGGNGLHVMGGQNIYVVNPLIGACGADRAGGAGERPAGILIEHGVTHLRITGGGVGPLPEMGSRARQYYGVRYAGTAEQAVRDSVRISGVDTVGNAVEFAPQSLALERPE
jgi:hypothetical protein